MIRLAGIEGLEELAERVSGLSRTVRGAAGSVAGQLARLFAEEARRRAPVRTGRLRDSIILRRAGEAEYVVEATAPYAGYVEYGSRPHTIEPRRARALRIAAEGEVVFARRVRHPGSAPRPFWRPALERVEAEARRVLAEEVVVLDGL